jgi:hypothetical protein
MKHRNKIAATLGSALFLALGLLSSPAASAADLGTTGVERIPMSVDLSVQSGAITTTVGTLDASCAQYRLCVWERRDYGGSKLVFSGADQGRWDTNFTIRSAKNRFSDRAVGFYNANTGERVRCLNPTTNRPGPFPDATRILIIGGPGSRC